MDPRPRVQSVSFGAFFRLTCGAVLLVMALFTREVRVGADVHCGMTAIGCYSDGCSDTGYPPNPYQSQWGYISWHCYDDWGFEAWDYSQVNGCCLYSELE